MLRFEHIPNPIFQKYISWKGGSMFGRKQWLDRAVIAEEYYYNDVERTGTTYTRESFERIKENTNIPVSVNFLHPVCNQKLALLTQTKPSFKVISTDGRAKLAAQVLDKMKHGVMSASSTQMEIESAAKDMLISGMGCLMVTPTDFYQPGMFNLSMVSVPYDEVVLDINSKRRSLDDMEGFFIEKAFTVPKVMQLYGDIITALQDENGAPVSVATFVGQVWIEGQLTEKAQVETGNWNTDYRVIVREFYEKVFTTMYMVKDEETGLLTPQFAENLELDQQALLANAEQKVEDVFIKKSILLGDYLVWEEILPITEYPLKAMFFEWGGKPYRSYGMMHFTVGMQEAYDKVLSMMLLNGILSNNAGWTAPKGTITEEDRKKWEDYANNPRVVKEYVPKVIENEVLKPEKDKVEQLGNFYPLVLEMLKSGIEYSSGITPILQGNAKEAGVEVFSSLQQYQNAAMMRVVLATSHVNETLRQLGHILIQYMAYNVKPDTYQFFDDKGELNELQLAQDMINNIRSFRYTVSTVPTTAMPTQRLATATELMKIAQSSPDPVERQILTQKAMELSEIREFDDIREQLDVVSNAQNKLKSLQEAYNRLMETSKQMENKYINISVENRIMKELMSKEANIEGKFAALETKLKLTEQLADSEIKGKQQPGE